MNSRQVLERNNLIVARYNQGVRCTKIATEFSLTPRTVQRIVRDRLGTPAANRKGKSLDFQLGHLREIVIELLRQQHRLFDKCEICNDPIPKGKFDLHHTKYEGATINDLLIVCRACNVSQQNKFLD